ncbi:MAG: LLM class flavin-dependent oxidoreductase [Thermoleophilia bacterium]|nr:LLM class flavin-dependent oxidoreductase [Thermoleophilia bacterium]
MRLAISLDYAAPPRPQVEATAALEDVGLDAVLVPEAYGLDGPTTLGYLAARTRRVAIGPAVLPVHTRSAALIAQTAAGLDSLSGGRAFLGLGVSGPAVVEGFHGVPFDAPLARLRGVVETCRGMWRREPPPGQALRPILAGPRPAIPVTLATLRPGGVALAAELADAWFPLFFAPEAPVFDGALARGARRRAPGLAPLETWVGAFVGVEGRAAAARAAAREHIALYVGGMGPRERNFYTDVVGRMGWAAEAERIQDLFLARRRGEAAAAVPEDMLDAFTLTGSPARVRARLAALADAGVTTLVMRGPASTDPAHLEALRRLAP